MPPDISKILADIYALDPALRRHEAQLTQLIQELLLSKPDTKFDEAFARRLHTELMQAPITQRQSVFSGYTSSMKKMIYTFFGSAAVVATALLITIFSGRFAPPMSRLLSLQSDKGVTQTLSHHKLAAGAFGDLAGTAPGSSDQKREATASQLALPTADLVAIAPTPTAGLANAGGGSAGMAPAALIARPYALPYAFVYKGDELSLTDKTVDVYRRIKLSNGRADLASALSSVSVGGLNLGSFTGSSLMNFELRQPTSDGYTISVQIAEGTVGISRSTPFSIEPLAVSGTGDNAPADSTIADDELLTIATAFLKNHAVDLSQYGTPVVQNQWQGILPLDTISARPQSAPAVEKTVLSMPYSITVLFPRTHNNHIVYDQGGNMAGISVNINVRNKAVDSVWGIQTTDYESSAYAAETNLQNFMKVLERGGMYGYGHPTDAQVPVVELGTPEQVYMQYWKYDNGANDELLVPALRFPVTKVSAGTYFYQTSVVIPLVAELLKDNVNPGPIMYLKGAESAAGNTATAASPPPELVPQNSK